jgi:hypothetical protein
VDWADLVTLDLSQFDVPGGKERLANQLRDAVHNVGTYAPLHSPHHAHHQDTPVQHSTAQPIPPPSQLKAPPQDSST